MAIDTNNGGGVSGFGIAESRETPLSGTGGAAGPGTRAGEGEPSGEGTSRGASPKEQANKLDPSQDAVDEAGELAQARGNEASREAAALGSTHDHDDTPALEFGEGDRPRAPTIGEALASGAGAGIGSGTPPDRSGLGGAAPVGEEGGPGPGGTRSPGGSGTN
jgi:hypothetical protein